MKNLNLAKRLSAIIVLVMLPVITAGYVSNNASDNNIVPDEVNEKLHNGRTESFISENIIIGSGTEYELSGLLTLPTFATEASPVPAVVLVHGSGANDMDETIYENKPFRDIAEYLSSNGIAVIRYDMRRYTHETKMFEELGGKLTAWEDRIEDAIFSAALVKTDPRIDESRVFILGHSLGGMLAPRIHASGGDFAGIISLAGSPRDFLLDVVRDQSFAFIESTMEGEEKEQALEAMPAFEEQVLALMDLPEETLQTMDYAGGLTYYYMQEMYKHPTREIVTGITVPFLVLHAGDDFQINENDFIAWKEVLDGRENATFKWYEGLNHLFMPSLFKDITRVEEEYSVPANVNTQVLRDIVEWVKEK